MPPQPLNDGAGYLGFQTPATAAGDFEAMAFVIRMMLGKVATSTLVKVVAVTNAGGVSPVGYVDIHPLVNQIDGAGNAMPHGVIYKCPYFRLQGGANAIILDPMVGDIGIAVFADRDISSASANKAESNPGSRRRHSMADGLYIGGVLNGLPTQYIEFIPAGGSPAKIKIHSPGDIVVEAQTATVVAPVVEIDASTSVTINAPTTTFNGNVAIVGALTNNSVNVGSTHKHSGVSTGASNTGNPI